LWGGIGSSGAYSFIVVNLFRLFLFPLFSFKIFPKEWKWDRALYNLNTE
jgi:hypothetical protein